MEIQIDQVWVSALYSVKKFIGNFFCLSVLGWD